MKKDIILHSISNLCKVSGGTKETGMFLSKTWKIVHIAHWKQNLSDLVPVCVWDSPEEW